MTQENRPPLFTSKSLRTLTKIVAIYAGFYLVTVIAQTITQPVSENPDAPQNAYMPLYFLATVHLVLGLSNLALIVSKKYNWFVPAVSGTIMILARVYYDDIALWVWSWS